MHCDWSTDSGNVEVEPFLVMYCDPHIQDGRVHVCNRLFAVRQPVSGNAEGLFDCLTRAFDHMGVSDWKNKLVGLGCDGTNCVNMAQNGLRGYLKIQG